MADCPPTDNNLVLNNLDTAFNAKSLHPNVEPLAGKQNENNSYEKSKDIYVALDRSGDNHSVANLAHFGISQAFAWEYLRKIKKATNEDLEYAKQLQKEMEDKLEQERLENISHPEDEIIAQNLQEELNKPKEEEYYNENGLRDSALARLIQQEEESKIALLIESSDFARKIANEVLTIDSNNTQLRDSELARILNDEFNNIRNSQNILPDVIKNEENLRNSNISSLPPYANISQMDSIKVLSSVYATGLINESDIHSSIHIGDSFINKYPIGSTVVIRSKDYPELKCTLNVIGNLAQPDSCIISQATMTILHVKSHDNINIELYKSEIPKTIQVEFQPSDWTFISNGLHNHFIKYLINEKFIIQHGEPILYNSNGTIYEVNVKSCLPENSQFYVGTNSTFISPVIPLKQSNQINIGEEQTLVCTSDDYIYLQLNIPDDKSWLEDDLLLSLDVLAGNINIFASQITEYPTVFSHQWTCTESFRITSTDNRVSYPFTKLYISVRSTARDGAFTISPKFTTTMGIPIRNTGYYNME